MGLKAKITIAFIALALLIVIVLGGFSLISFRQLSIDAAREHARSAAEIVRVTLTEAMLHGTIDTRQAWLQRMRRVEGLELIKVVRSKAVVDQFGPGSVGETDIDAIEQAVIIGRKPYFDLVKDVDPPLFRATIPYVADALGQPNCLQCHTVADGTILGAITLHISLREQRQAAIRSALTTTAVLLLFTLIAVLVARRMIAPLLSLAGEIQGLVRGAREGDFSVRIRETGKDEIARIGTDLNAHMYYLERSLTTMGNQVADLMRYQRQAGGNVLSMSLEMVQNLVDASHYKQAIEEDETRDEIYQRLMNIFEEQFMLDHYAIYEVDNQHNRMQQISTTCTDKSPCHWCSPDILIRADTCRARRTGRPVNELENPGICTAFQPPQDGTVWRHVCIPITQSGGGVGAVIQTVTAEQHLERLRESLPYLMVYLRETAPVLEAKRLMADLRESSLRDPMTGLHNRRFLEEYLDTLTSHAERQKTSFSILMLDVDYFKKVNDTYGHEAGDIVLCEVARTMRQTLRSSDIMVRYGGEEFLAVVRDSKDCAGDQVAEKIRATVEALEVDIGTTKIRKTISIGVADFPDDSASVWQTIKYADVALYQAKERGRNQVLHFTPDMWKNEENF